MTTRGSDDQPRDEDGRFASGGGGEAIATPDREGASLDGAAARELHGLVDAAHDDIESKLSEFSDSKDELDSAADARVGTEGELGEDEVYTDDDDQADYEQRHDAAGEEAAKQAFAARDKLQALIKAAQGHLDKINSSLNAAEDAGNLFVPSQRAFSGARSESGIAIA